MNSGVERLMVYVDMIEDEELREKVRDFLSDLRVTLTGEDVPLDWSPGGLSKHHAYEGGLLQHTEATIRLGLLLCDLVEGLYQGRVRRDVVIAVSYTHLTLPTILLV